MAAAFLSAAFLTGAFLADAFLEGALFIYGHTVAQRALGIGYQSQWTANHLATRQERNAFYATLGRRVQPGTAGLRKLAQVYIRSPEAILEAL